ncbi:MAG: cytochrome c biogenesis protein CcsA [Bacteroidia bacterium]
MENNFSGEHLFPGYLGYLFVALSFGFALYALISYYFSLRNPLDRLWRNSGRTAFVVHSVAILGIIGTLFYLIYNHYYEYDYVWKHSSNDLPVYYMISCFWEGQEGSFLLWAFWHVVLGLILIRVAGKWEAPVMMVMAAAQLTLTSMLLGIEIFDTKIGSNPFILLRDAMAGAPIFASPDYLEKITDGNGLNPLLQNYWMVIHPPVLFLGFASTIIPFAYAMGGLWKREYTEWIKPAFPWTAFSVAIFGVGILMGGAWAYEALSFGGFWAWDPVENASLIPWLVLVAGLHVMLIYKKTGNSLKLAYILLITTFILVLYATFLTRSGILGDTSVHSFTDLGLSGQLIFFMAFFLIAAIISMAVSWKKIPVTEREEKLYSREFWMFIGALVLLLSAAQIVISTSIPVFNAIAGTNFAPPTEPIAHYNKFQVPIAMVIALLTGMTQYLRYRNTPKKLFLKRLFRGLGIGLIISVGLIALTGVSNVLYILLLFFAVFTIVGNLDIMIPMIRKKNLRSSGASVAHIGIGFLLLGALISNAQQEVISINSANISFGEAFDEESTRENIMLIKDRPVVMGRYVVTYKGDSVSPPNTYYKVEYRRVDSETLEEKERFVLYPVAQINPQTGLTPSPDTRHYFSKDIFTHVSSVPDKTSEDYWDHTYKEPRLYHANAGDTLHLEDKTQVVVESILPFSDSASSPIKDVDIAVTLEVKVMTSYASYDVRPSYLISGTTPIRLPKEIRDLGLKIELAGVHPEQEKKLSIAISKAEDHVPDYIIMKAIIFPYINFLWIGSVVMVIGLTMSIVYRVKELKRQKA